MAQLTGAADRSGEGAPQVPGAQPWEILISEAQERMTLAVDPRRIEEFSAWRERGTWRRRCWAGSPIRDSSTSATARRPWSTSRCPSSTRPAADGAEGRVDGAGHEEPAFVEPADLGEALKAMLGRLNICSKESVVRQYDHEVQGERGQAVDRRRQRRPVRRRRDPAAPRLLRGGGDRPRDLPRYSDIDTYHMAACAIDEAVRNASPSAGRSTTWRGSTTSAGAIRSSRRRPRRRVQARPARPGQPGALRLTTAYGVP